MENDAVVSTAEALPNVTVPGPEVLVHVCDRVLPVGLPSSVIVPSRDAPAGRVMVWSGPAFTDGAALLAGPR
jgi:hypothetical protein